MLHLIIYLFVIFLRLFSILISLLMKNILHYFYPLRLLDQLVYSFVHLASLFFLVVSPIIQSGILKSPTIIVVPPFMSISFSLSCIFVLLVGKCVIVKSP